MCKPRLRAHVRPLHGIVAACVTLCCAPMARADPLDSLTLRFTAPESCPADESLVRADAVRLLPAEGEYEPIAVDLVVTHSDGAYRIALTARTQTRQAERSLEVKSCQEVYQTAALLVALVVDPEAAGVQAEPTPDEVQRDSTQQPQPAAPSPDAPAPESSAGPARGPQPEPRQGLTPFGLELGISGLSDTAVLPALAFGPGLALGLYLDRMSIVGTSTWLLMADARTEHPTARVEAELWTAGLQACYRFPVVPWLSLEPCAAGEAGVYGAGSTGVENARSDSAAWLAASAALAGRLELGQGIALRAALGLLAPLRRPVLAFRDLGTVYRVPAVSMRAQLGLCLWFGK